MPQRTELTLCQTHRTVPPTDPLLLGTATGHRAPMSPLQPKAAPRPPQPLLVPPRWAPAAGAEPVPSVQPCWHTRMRVTPRIPPYRWQAAAVRDIPGGRVKQQLCCQHHALLCLRLFPHSLTAEQASLNIWGIQGGYAELVATAQTRTDLPGRARDRLEVQ